MGTGFSPSGRAEVRPTSELKPSSAGTLVPFTLDNSVWYFGRSFSVIALMSAFVAYAFWISLAGQPMFGLVLEED